jgi:hypothetical protein
MLEIPPELVAALAAAANDKAVGAAVDQGDERFVWCIDQHGQADKRGRVWGR